ncbi:unnamed protein product [Cunninghamella blakesleeana]
MVSHLSFLFVTLGLTSMMVNANMAPSYPEPGTVWEEGKEYEVVWDNDSNEPNLSESWNNFRIDLMTGDDDKQIFITNVASNLTGTALKYKYSVPSVEPHAPVYFLMFTSETGENAWTTRFAIVGQDGKQDVPENAIQPNGAKIPWGVGKLSDHPINQANVTSSGPASSASALPSLVSPSASLSASASNSNNIVAAAATPSSGSLPITPSSNTPSNINIHNPIAESMAASVMTSYAITFIMVVSLGVIFV